MKIQVELINQGITADIDGNIDVTGNVNIRGGILAVNAVESQDLQIVTGAGFTLVLNSPVHKDLDPLSVTVGSGVNAPAFTVYNGNLRAYEFPGGGQLKELNLGFQINHDYCLESDLEPHLHLYIPNDANGGTIKFSLEYTWTNIGQAGAVTTTTIIGTLTVTVNAGILNNALLSFPEVAGAGKGLSSMFMARLYRDPADAADTFGSSVWLKAMDLHYEVDTLGSRQELVK
jgi:hypothetical protein